MNPEEEGFDPKLFNKEKQNQKKQQIAAEAIATKINQKNYKLNYDSKNLDFTEVEPLGELILSGGSYPIFARQELLDSDEWKDHGVNIKKALSSVKTASAKAEDGIKILKHKDGKHKDKDWNISKNIVLVELKVFGGKKSGGVGSDAWDWRAVGLRDANQKCIILLEGLSEAHTGDKLSALCKGIEEKLGNLGLGTSPQGESGKVSAKNLNSSSRSR